MGWRDGGCCPALTRRCEDDRRGTISVIPAVTTTESHGQWEQLGSRPRWCRVEFHCAGDQQWYTRSNTDLGWYTRCNTDWGVQPKYPNGSVVSPLRSSHLNSCQVKQRSICICLSSTSLFLPQRWKEIVSLTNKMGRKI